jgi:hypothetical protein
LQKCKIAACFCQIAVVFCPISGEGASGPGNTASTRRQYIRTTRLGTRQYLQY